MALALPHYSIISLEWENDQVIQGQDIDNLQFMGFIDIVQGDTYKL